MSSIFVVLIHEMGVFTSSNTSVCSGVYSCIYISLMLLSIVCIFTEHALKIAFIPVTLFISQETEGLYFFIIRENSKLKFSRHIFLLFCRPDRIFSTI